MPSLEKIDAYISLLCEQIRWEKAHPRIVEEMKNHIIDQRDALMAEGLDEDAATEKAIENTGDAAIIGAQFDRTHRPKPQWAMLAATAVLIFIGLFIRLTLFRDENVSPLLSSGFLSAILGIVALFIAYFSDFSLLGKYPRAAYFLVIAVFIWNLQVSPRFNGAAYYAQYIILLFPLALCAILFTTRNKGYHGIILCEFAFALLGSLTMFVPSASGFVLFSAAGVILLCVAIYKNWFGVKRLYGFLLVLAPMLFAGVVFLLFMNAHDGWLRLATAINPSLDPNGAGYIGTMTRELLGNAQLFGVGNVPSQYAMLLSDPTSIFRTDLVLTAVTVLLGWTVVFAVLGALLFFILKGFWLCLKQKSGLGLFVSLAIMMTFTLQVVSYVAFNFGFAFFAPLSLPLLSYGNTAMVINLGLIGFMLSVFRTGNIINDGEISQVRPRLFSWENGKLTINFKA